MEQNANAEKIYDSTDNEDEDGCYRQDFEDDPAERARTYELEKSL